MSTCSIAIAKNRIKTAPPDSPIAVFQNGADDKHVDVYFLKTVYTAKRLAIGDPSLIGVYHGPEGSHIFSDDLIRTGIREGRYNILA